MCIVGDYIIGIDASLSSTGVAVKCKSTGEIVEVTRYCTKKGQFHPDGKEEDEDGRVYFIATAIRIFVGKYNIKNAYMESQFIGKSAKTGMQLSRLRGAIMMMLRLLQCNLQYIAPSTIKKAVGGKGNCSKEDVANAILTKHAGNPKVVALGKFDDKTGKNKNSDMYDAIAICETAVAKG